MASLGVMSKKYPEVAVKLMLDSLELAEKDLEIENENLENTVKIKKLSFRERKY